ncbi:MAG: hypothetical protein ACE5NA_00210 [Nitrospiraceae bacterium]
MQAGLNHEGNEQVALEADWRNRGGRVFEERNITQSNGMTITRLFEQFEDEMEIEVALDGTRFVNTTDVK